MKQNMGAIDRIVRCLLAVLIALLYYNNIIFGPAAAVLGIFAAAFLITSFMGFCPLYVPFKISTCRKED